MIECVVIFGALICSWLYINFKRRYVFASEWPNLEPRYPVIGNANIMIGKNDLQRFENIVNVFQRSERLVKVWNGPVMILFINHPDLVQQILSSPACLEKPFLYGFAGFKTGIFTAKCNCNCLGVKIHSK